MTLISGISSVSLRQAVVRLRSRQSLERTAPDGEVLPGAGKVQEKVEYVVVQKRYQDGKEKPWIVWGTVEESDWKKVVFD